MNGWNPLLTEKNTPYFESKLKNAKLSEESEKSFRESTLSGGIGHYYAELINEIDDLRNRLKSKENEGVVVSKPGRSGNPLKVNP